jgi:hypothetical protein
MDPDFEVIWNQVMDEVSKPFGERLEVESVLFLIGVQELGMGPRKFSKDQKLDVLHVAICTLLEPYGYYEFIGRDEARCVTHKHTYTLTYTHRCTDT